MNQSGLFSGVHVGKLYIREPVSVSFPGVHVGKLYIHEPISVSFPGVHVRNEWQINLMLDISENTKSVIRINEIQK